MLHIHCVFWKFIMLNIFNQYVEELTGWGVGDVFSKCYHISLMNDHWYLQASAKINVQYPDEYSGCQ